VQPHLTLRFEHEQQHAAPNMLLSSRKSKGHQITGGSSSYCARIGRDC
jgi:hypothetical protein